MTDQTGRVPASSDPLSTGHLLTGLGRRTASNAAVTTASQGIRFVVNITSTLVLARLLTPQDFGLVAMVTAFTGFLELIKDGGLSIATIQRQEITQGQVSNLFWVNLGLGFSITCVVAGSAPVIAWFYGEPRLVPVTIAVSLTFLLTASAVQHQAIMRRQMRFVAVATIQIVASVTSLAVAIGMACTGWGYWSLVGSLLAGAVTNGLTTWLLSDWRPGLAVRGVGTRNLVGFGAHLTGAALLQTTIKAVDTLLIGRFYGPDAVGFYSRGSALLINPLQQFLSPFSAVLVPTLARVQDDPERFRRLFLPMLQLIALLALPMAGFLLASSEPLVDVLLGEKWAATVPIFTAFSVIAVYGPIGNASTWLFTSQGRGGELLSASFICSVFTLLSIIVGTSFGPVGVALCYSLSGLLISLPVLFYFAGRRGPIRTRELWDCLLTNVPLGVLVFFTTFATHWTLSNCSSLVQLIVMIPASAAVAVTFVLCSPFHLRTISVAVARFRGEHSQFVSMRRAGF
ncbi:MAG: lipopolysaccharide biosynthesis protein [Gemmataceae bacterium]